jgi:hypothetical protein
VAVAASHYGTLGVADGASPDEVRRAYLDLARQLHPDRWIDASPSEREDAGRRMQQLNEAWRVLGNPARRLAYDVERREAGRRSRVSPPTAVGERFAFSTGDLFVEDVDDPDLLSRLLRALPWILVILGLGGIFVFTAYATSDNGVAPTGEGGGGCIRKDGGRAVAVDCEADGAQRVIIEVREVGECPAESEPFQPLERNVALCLAPPG